MLGGEGIPNYVNNRRCSRQRAGYLLAAGAMLLLSWPSLGCKQAPPQFEENRLAITDAELVTAHRQQIAQVLTEQFGTPDEPCVPEGIDLDVERLRMAAGPAGYIKYNDGEEYQQRGLFRQHCASCHGVTGNGQGPAAAVLAPYPRDFRPGVFKFKSTYLGDKPLDADLRRTINNGIPGTAMPSFALLDEEQTNALVEYVKYLAMRGAAERELIAAVADEFDFDPADDSTDDALDPQQDDDDATLVEQSIATAMKPWKEENKTVVVPSAGTVPPADRDAEEVAKSMVVGRELFSSERAKCTDCHGMPGQSVVAKDYDDWNAAVVEFRRRTSVLAASVGDRRERLAQLPPDQQEQAELLLAADERQLRRRQQVGATLLEAQLDRPRTLAGGVYHGGSDPVDLFRRVHQGIAGTPMSGHGPPRPGVAGSLSEVEIWHLVDYLQSLGKGDQL